MPKEGWTNIGVRKSLVKEAGRIAAKRHYPNVSQYVNDAIRRALDEDRAKLAIDQK